MATAYRARGPSCAGCLKGKFRTLDIWILSYRETDIFKPFLATQLIKDAMLRLDPSCAVFTSTHLLLVRLCLHAKAYTCILPVLNKHICHFPGISERSPPKGAPVLCADHESSLAFITNNSGLSAPLGSRDLSRYFLYGGMVYLALKKWSEASHFLELVMAIPTTGPVSMIMVEAYKKWVLVGLLETGKVSQAEPSHQAFSDTTHVSLHC
jgi:COP9 signalosome complex subunit 3